MEVIGKTAIFGCALRTAGVYARAAAVMKMGAVLKTCPGWWFALVLSVFPPSISWR